MKQCDPPDLFMHCVYMHVNQNGGINFLIDQLHSDFSAYEVIYDCFLKVFQITRD